MALHKHSLLRAIWGRNEMMKALILKRYGKSDQIDFADIPRPTIKDDELLVQVHAAGLNPIDCMIPKGSFLLCNPHL